MDTKEMKTESVHIIQTDASKSRVISSLIWKFLERGGTQGVQFLIQIVLARLLAPGDYGVLAILMAFITFANIFVQSGLNTALIQKKETDETDFSSIFWISLVIASILYIIFFFIAPIIADFYRNDTLIPILRVLSITLFFGAFNSIQNAMVSKTMQFKRFFFSSMGGAIGSGIVGIFFAYKGLGVWALVIQHLTNNFLISIILWFTVKWRPLFLFSLEKVKHLFSYGWKLLLSSILTTGYTQIYSLVVGRVFSSSDLGFFNRGEQFPTVIALNVDGSIQSVMLPTLSSHKDNFNDMKRLLRRSIRTSSYILIPCMFGMAAVAKNLISVLLGKKWLPCVPYLQLACLYFAFYPVHTTNLTAVNAMGRSDVYLKLEIIKEIERIIVLIITIPFGLLTMAVGRVFTGIAETFINVYPNKKILDYRYIEQIQDILPSLAASGVMAATVYFVGNLPLPNIFCLMFQIAIGIILYLLISKIFKIEALSYLLETFREQKGKAKC